MHFARGSYHGPSVRGADAAARPDRPTADQVRARRNALWLFAVRIGIPDERGRMRKHSPRELAGLWGVSTQAIRNGIASALAIRDRVLARDADDDAVAGDDDD